MDTRRFSRNGSALRGLVIAICLIALVWMVYLVLLPQALQQRELLTFIGAMVCAGVLVGLVWMCQPRAQVKRTFWLSQDGESEPSGPYTVAQLVAMWKAGQITTRGMVTEEGKEAWMPILAFADQFDESLTPPAKSFSLRRVLVALMLVLILVVIFGRPVAVPQREKTLGEQLREFQSSPRGQQIRAEAEAEFAAEQKAADARKAELDAKVQAALETAKPQGLPPPPLK